MLFRSPRLHAIRRPTLLVSAEDDPMIPGTTHPRDLGGTPYLHPLVTARGGHVGFVAGSLRAPFFWAEAQVLAFFSTQK